MRRMPAYRESVLPARGARARRRSRPGPPGCGGATSVSAGRVIGIDHYGASGKAPELYKKFGITAEHVLQEILDSIKGTVQ